MQVGKQVESGADTGLGRKTKTGKRVINKVCSVSAVIQCRVY